MADRLRMDHPEHYYRIIELFKGRRLVLSKDYYFFHEGLSKKEMMDFHFQLLKDRWHDEEIKSIAKDEITEDKVRFRIPQLESFLMLGGSEIPEPFRKSLFDDLNEFERKLSSIVMERFAMFNRRRLYARDLLSATMGERVFGSDQTTSIIAVSEFCVIIESQFDWSGWIL